ncbi:MAG TPA: hypothetical protein VNT26_09530, partial [Candidatus Sulfotelmatobacter sp.]|nr:hypothetical protein [Candidatus Sulfotelmatobacter sp.]
MNSCFRTLRVAGLLLGLVSGHVVQAGEGTAPEQQVVLLQPAPVPPLRIDLDYNFQKALPPFPKEPVLPGKELARGRIPTVPPTPVLRNIADKELYLNVEHLPDFVSGKLTTYRSTYNGHVFFKDLRVSSVREGLGIPYTVDLFTYEHGFAGWLQVRTGWKGQCTLGGQTWQLGVVDNLDGRIGPEDTLYLLGTSAAKGGQTIPITPVPQTLFFAGEAFDLSFVFKPGTTGTALETVLTPTNLPLGKLSIAAQGCTFLRLANDRLAVVLDAKAGTVAVPVGTYRIADCLLEAVPGQVQQPQFIRAARTVTITAGQTTAMELGFPLRNTVQVTRDRNLLRLTYQLL